MSLFQEISAAWPEFRAVAGVDPLVDGEPVEAVLLEPIRDASPHLEQSSTTEKETRLAFRIEAWRKHEMGEEKEVFFEGRRWRIGPFEENPIHPIVFANLTTEGDA